MKAAITGTPGTGKSTVAKIVAEMTGYGLVDVNEFARSHGLFQKKDEKRDSWIVDERALKKVLSKLKGNIILEGHLAHYSKPDIAVVLRLNPRELEKRLEKRGWKKEKIKENVEAEALGVCLAEALDECKSVFEVDATGKSAEDAAKEAADIINGKGRESHLPGRIDWSESLTPVA